MHNAKVLISWNDEFLLGDEHIDTEHKMLFDIAKKANNVYSLPTEPEQKELLKEVVEELHSYVNFHFKNEEDYMSSIDYPALLEHKKVHSKLLELLSFISLNLEIIGVSQTGQDLYDFIQDIFVNHMITEDTKIIKYKKEIS